MTDCSRPSLRPTLTPFPPPPISQLSPPPPPPPPPLLRTCPPPSSKPPPTRSPTQKPQPSSCNNSTRKSSPRFSTASAPGSSLVPNRSRGSRARLSRRGSMRGCSRLEEGRSRNRNKRDRRRRRRLVGLEERQRLVPDRNLRPRLRYLFKRSRCRRLQMPSRCRRISSSSRREPAARRSPSLYRLPLRCLFCTLRAVLIPMHSPSLECCNLHGPVFSAILSRAS